MDVRLIRELLQGIKKNLRRNYGAHLFESRQGIKYMSHVIHARLSCRDLAFSRREMEGYRITVNMQQQKETRLNIFSTPQEFETRGEVSQLPVLIFELPSHINLICLHCADNVVII